MAKRKFVVKRKLTVQKTYRKWEDWDIGDIVIGEYQAVHKDQYGKDCPVIRVEDAFFKDKKVQKEVIGKNLVLNANGMLSKALEGIDLGEIIQVEYRGKSSIEKGPYKGKEAHLVQVDLVEEDDSDLADEDEDEDEVGL
jgi:hypothetical protein